MNAQNSRQLLGANTWGRGPEREHAAGIRGDRFRNESLALGSRSAALTPVRAGIGADHSGLFGQLLQNHGALSLVHPCIAELAITRNILFIEKSVHNALLHCWENWPFDL